MPSRLNIYFKNRIRIIDQALDRLLPRASESPRLLHRAMRYSVFAGGKRLRPVLVLAAAEACGNRPTHVLPAACAMELIHTYSLIHDDLPAMDDDDLRRGRPTNHRVFGEATAVLAGDALLTHAFDLIAQNGMNQKCPPALVLRAIRAVVAGAGADGMIGGQVADIQSEKGLWKKRNTRFEKLPPGRLLTFIHTRKTAALITASLVAGAILSRASAPRIKAFQRYGLNIGLAFQVKDDLLDITGDKKKLGKCGSDRANQKLTYPALYGSGPSESILRQLIDDAHTALHPFGRKAAVLHDLADFIRDRDR